MRPHDTGEGCLRREVCVNAAENPGQSQDTILLWVGIQSMKLEKFITKEDNFASKTQKRQLKNVYSQEKF